MLPCAARRSRSPSPTICARALLGAVFLAALGCVSAGCAAGSSAGSGGGGGGGGGSSSASTGSGVPSNCEELCATEESLACPSATTGGCVGACESAKSAVTWCGPIVSAATDCLANEPASSFECDMNGDPASKAGVCANELGAIGACWYEGLPDLGQACAGVCANEAGLPCADPSCESNCTNALTQKCKGAFGALVLCGSKMDASSFECSMQTPAFPVPKQGVCAFELSLLIGCLQQP